MNRYVIIGNGKMAIDCLKMAVEAGIGDVALVVCDSLEETPVSRIATACEELGIPCRDNGNVNDPALVEEIRAIEPDVIFNINSFKIIREDLLAIPKTGVINFHNGPLPRYGGVNVCSWAILEGAPTYGIIWMFVSRGVDTGDLVEQSLFDLTGREAAVSLVGRCIKEGIRVFPNLLAQIKAGTSTGFRKTLQRRHISPGRTRPTTVYSLSNCRSTLWIAMFGQCPSIPWKTASFCPRSGSATGPYGWGACR
jgi:methionyl-tRNA formyltransferase